MTHTVELNSHQAIEIRLIGAVNVQDVATMGKQIMNLIIRLEDQGQPVNILIDYSQQSGIESLANSLAKPIARDLHLHKLAVFQLGQEAIDRFEEVRQDNGSAKKMRIFPDRQAAEEWLYSE